MNTAQAPGIQAKVEGKKINNDFSEFEFDWSNNCHSTRRRLKKNWIFWQKKLSANSAILEIIGKAYKIPFLKTTKGTSFCDNQSSLKSKFFVGESIPELLKCGSFIETEKPLKEKNPLFRSKHHLEGKEGYLFKFDSKNRYHHLDIF